MNPTRTHRTLPLRSRLKGEGRAIWCATHVVDTAVDDGAIGEEAAQARGRDDMVITLYYNAVKCFITHSVDYHHSRAS